MFIHNFKYTLKILLKNRTLVFWAIAWPLILGTLFNMAFSNIANSDKLETINIGVLNDESYSNNTYLKSTITTLSDETNKDYLFNTVYKNKDDLNKLLDDKKIDGYIFVEGNTTKIIVKESSINQTIIKYVVDEVEEYKNLTTSLIGVETKELASKGQAIDVNQIYNEVITKLNQNKTYTNNVSKKGMDYMMVEYYTLLAMACLFSAMLSSEAIKNYLGNSNRKGSRVTLAPIKRLGLILSGFMASLIIQIVSITALLLFTKFILNVDYGTKVDLIVLLSFIGSLAGISLGILVGSIPFKGDTSRNVIMNVVVMLGCFFSGMMGVQMKYVIDTNAPLLNTFNPANMITDGFYALYFYDNLTRFYFDIMSLIVVIIIFITISCYYLRRKKYDSI